MIKKLASLGGVACASIIAGIYALRSSNSEKYKSKIPSYKKTANKVKDYIRDNDSMDLYMVDPENREWWSARGKEFGKFYKGDWQDFRDKCFSEMEDKKSEWSNVLNGGSVYYSEAWQVSTTDFKFLSICLTPFPSQT
ncbi:hypothetical protein HF1_03750 [Mycoplasma haemofelis str. Langford 1]|uniref:Uncharacterized protein n=1 Tax=Mycoplasma haemofelis (strain Langford 1) TaxID=941640 RepID=E8ZGW2_MYCHL|nr:hypothetical protein HF1_03750 [Mycoplasma haemofelis str. Langford 1]